MEKKSKRRSVDNLLKDIYASSINVLKKYGYENVSFSNIAREAHTSRTVLYRRWPDARSLLFEAVDYYSNKDQSKNDDVKKSGFYNHSLRDNIVRSLCKFIESPQFFDKQFNLIAIENENPFSKEIIDNLKERYLKLMDEIFKVAIEKNEIKRNVPQNIKLIPLELLMFQALIEPSEASRTFIENQVDSIVMPAIENSQK